jgi:hypothetical protein
VPTTVLDVTVVVPFAGPVTVVAVLVVLFTVVVLVEVELERADEVQGQKSYELYALT